jgi:hypothetical protein
MFLAVDWIGTEIVETALRNRLIGPKFALASKKTRSSAKISKKPRDRRGLTLGSAFRCSAI